MHSASACTSACGPRSEADGEICVAVSRVMMAIIRVAAMALEEDNMVIMNVVAVLIKEETWRASAEITDKHTKLNTLSEIFLIKLTTF